MFFLKTFFSCKYFKILNNFLFPFFYLDAWWNLKKKLRQPSRNTNRGNSQYAGDTQSTVAQSGRGTHPPYVPKTINKVWEISKIFFKFTDVQQDQHWSHRRPLLNMLHTTSISTDSHLPDQIHSIHSQHPIRQLPSAARMSVNCPIVHVAERKFQVKFFP